MDKAPATLHAQEVPEYTGFQQYDTNKTLKIALNGKLVAFLYLTPTDYTFAWDGGVDFQHLEDEVNSALKAFGWSNLSLSAASWRSRISAALILPTNDGFDELLEYHLGISEQYVQYSETMKHSAALSFVRYDFTDRGQLEVTFSFMAENAALYQNLENEVAITVLRSRKCSENMIQWIITHHRQFSLLRDVIVEESLISTLNRHIGDI